MHPSPQDKGPSLSLPLIKGKTPKQEDDKVVDKCPLFPQLGMCPYFEGRSPSFAKEKKDGLTGDEYEKERGNREGVRTHAKEKETSSSLLNQRETLYFVEKDNLLLSGHGL
jgi:hypothetical protein